MKICVNAGHTLTGKGSGAIGYINESKETRKVVEALVPLLKEKGHEVITATIDKSNDYLNEVVTKANQSEADLFLSIHFNAGKGKGVECYTWKGRKLDIAVDICENLNELGFKNRGVKDGSVFYVIKRTTMEAMIVEVCFVDTMSDVARYKILGAKKIAKAIAEAIW